MAEKDKVPEYIKLYEDLKKKAGRILATTKHVHSEAYLKAADTILRGKDGLIDPELLDDLKKQEEFVEKMTEHYIKAANKHFGSKLTPKDQVQIDQLMGAYAGITRSQLLEYIKNKGKEYTIEEHERVRGYHMRQVEDQLTKSTASHLKEEHISGFIKHMGIEDLVNASQMRVQDITKLHDVYENIGTVNEKMVRDTYKGSNDPPPVYFKKKKKDKK